jgi:hypothetical protein
MFSGQIFIFGTPCNHFPVSSRPHNFKKMAVAGLALGAVGKEMGGRERSCTDGLGAQCTVACTGRRERSGASEPRPACALAMRSLTGLASAVGAGVFYLLESPTSPVPYATSRETPHEAGPLKGILQGIPDILWPENKNPFARDGTYYEHKVRRPQGVSGRKAHRDRYLR